MELDDGTFIPSFLNVGDSSDTKGGFLYSVTDTSLRVGRVVAAYSPDDEQNRNKKVIEYDVIVRHSDSGGGETSIRYPRVIIASLFGGFSDYFKWTPRIDNFEHQNQIGLSSNVLILCINGNHRAAYIVGAVPHPDILIKEKAFKDNHHLEFEFNGIFARVNNDGDFKLLHKGATKSDGKIIDEAGKNSTVLFTKEGNVSIGYLADDSTSDTFVVDSTNYPYAQLVKADKQIKLFAPSDIHSQTNANFIVQTKTGVKINQNGSEQQAFVRGSKIRSEQTTLHNKLAALLGALQQSLSAVSTQLTSAATALAVPVTGGPAASPLLATAAGTLSGVASTFGELQSAFQAFENLSSQYLSDKHEFSDEFVE